MFFMILIVLPVLILTLCAQGRLLSKAGENGAKILIPFYGSYLLYKACDATGMFVANICLSVVSFLLGMAGAGEVISLLIMVGSLLINIFFSLSMARAYGRSGGFAVGLIFLPLIFQCILAFGDSEHVAYTSQWKATHQKGAAIATWRCPVCNAEMPVSRLSCTECGEKRP
ncbi:MAG: hypothetical protein IJD39_06325 [Clostridia bacterium]|nr:hypothetical protein [Clostridia bacterium]